MTELADTAARLRALTDLLSTLLVEAAAGTGKTALMAGRVTMLLASGLALSLLLCLPIVWLVAFRLHLRSVWALRNETPVEMYAEIEVVQDSESTSYYACLRDAPGGAVIHRLSVYALFGKSDLPREPQPAKVFIDRLSRKPMVIEMQGKRWWTRAL